MAAQLTSGELGMVDDLNRAAQAMVLVLAKTGSGQYTQEVETFQVIWNAVRPAINRVAGTSLPLLVEDGKYGPNTSGILSFVVGGPGTAPPRYASGMPTWYAANHDRITALVSPREVDPIEVDAYSGGGTLPNPDTMAAQDVRTAQDSGSLITSNASLDPSVQSQVVQDPTVQTTVDPYSTPWWKSSDPGSYPLTVIDEQGCPPPRWINRHTAKVQEYKLLFEIDDCLNQEGVKQGKLSPYWPPCGENDISCLQSKMIKAGVSPDDVSSIPLSQLQQMESALMAGQEVFFSQVSHGGTTAPAITGESGNVIVAEDMTGAEIPIVVTPVRKDYRLVALLVAAGALGGALWYMRKRTPRRRAA